MRLSTKSRFAVAAMIDLALRENAGPVSLTDISARHEISVSYLEQLFSRLRQHRLVESTRGPGGGYALARPSESISVADIIGAIEPATAKGQKHAVAAQAADESMTRELWAALNTRMVEHMQSISLARLAGEQRVKGVKVEQRPARRGVYTAPKRQAAPVAAPNSVFALGGSLLGSR